MKQIIKYLIVFGLFFAISTTHVQAGSCTTLGECVDGRVCEQLGGVLYKGSTACGDAVGKGVIGGVTPPKAIKNLNLLARIRDGESVGIGLVIFLSRGLRLFTIITGLLVIANTVVIAYMYITESDSSDVQTKVKDKLTMTVIGLVIIVGAYTLAAIVGLIFFGDARFILSPELYSALDQVP